MPSPPPALEQELLRLAEAVAPERDARVAVRHWGWDGRGGVTLEAAGREAGGLSRERARQLCARVEARLREGLEPAAGDGPTGTGLSGPVAAPRLDEALRVAAEAVPTTCGALARSLADLHVSARLFHPAGLAHAAPVLGRETTFTRATIRGIEVAVPSPDDPALDTRQLIAAVVDTAHDVVRRTGAARIADLAGRVANRVGAAVDEDLVCAVVSESDDFVWLDRRTGWFFLPSVARNAVVTRVRKVLSVAAEIEVGRLHASVRRDERMREFVMPEYVLAELCQRVPGLAVDGRNVRAIEPLQPEAVLEATELAFVGVLKEYGAPIERRELERLCRARGVTASSFSNRVAYSPLLEEVEHGRYALRGTTGRRETNDDRPDDMPRPGDLEHFRPPRRR